MASRTVCERLGKGTVSGQKIKIRDAMNRIHIISHTQREVHLKFQENIVQNLQNYYSLDIK